MRKQVPGHGYVKGLQSLHRANCKRHRAAHTHTDTEQTQIQEICVSQQLFHVPCDHVVSFYYI